MFPVVGIVFSIPVEPVAAQMAWCACLAGLPFECVSFGYVAAIVAVCLVRGSHVPPMLLWPLLPTGGTDV